MATNFPTSIDTYSNVADGNTIQIATTNNMQDAIEALEAKVGADSSAVTTSHDYKIGAIETILGSATAADLTKLHGVTATAAELNKLDADTLTVGDLLTKGAGGMDVITAVAATQYLKSAGTSTKPAYGKLSLSDTGVAIGSFTQSSNHTASIGFEPSAVIFIAAMYSAVKMSTSIGIDDGTTSKSILMYHDSSVIKNYPQNGCSVCVADYPSGSSGYSTGHITATSSTGFTFTWTSNDVSATVYYLALP